MYQGQFTNFKVDLAHLFKCASCGFDMGSPQLYKQEYEDFDHYFEEIDLEKPQPTNAPKKVKMDLVAFGLINECSKCGNLPVYLKAHPKGEDTIVKVCPNIKYRFNNTTKEVQLAHCSHPFLEGFRVVSFLYPDPDIKEINASYIKQFIQPTIDQLTLEKLEKAAKGVLNE